MRPSARSKPMSTGSSGWWRPAATSRAGRGAWWRSGGHFLDSPADAVYKGGDLGFFQFGGSDVIVLFEKDAVDLTAVAGTHCLQGQAIGTAWARPR